MTTTTQLRDRLLLRLMSHHSRDALAQVLNYSLEDEIKDLVSSSYTPDHIALPLAHLADLVNGEPQWKTHVQEVQMMLDLKGFDEHKDQS